MRPSKSPAKSATSVFSALLLFGVAVPCSARESPVTVGEVRDESASGAFSEALRGVLDDAMARAELGRPRERFVLSATLLRLDAEPVGKGARATALVSLALRRAREQSLHAVLNGRATAEEASGSVSETRTDALRAAVTSALRRLPEAVR